MSDYPTQEQDSRIRVRWNNGKDRPGYLTKLQTGKAAELSVDPKKAIVFHSFQRDEVDKLVADLGVGYEAVETAIS